MFHKIFEKKNEPSSEVREGSGSRSESILRKSFLKKDETEFLFQSRYGLNLQNRC